MVRLFKILLVNLTIFLLLLLIMEVVIRIKGDSYTWSEKGQRIYVDPWEREIVSNLQIRNSGSYQESYPEFNYNLEINEDGVRDVARSIEKPSNMIRVLGLGDSFMEGMGAELDSTIMYLLNKKLVAKHSPDWSFETMNGGVAGSDIFRSFNLLQERLIKYEPDYCIILFNNTDFNDWLIKGNENGVSPPMSPPSKIERFLFKHSHLYRSFTINILHHSWLQQSPKEQKVLWEFFVEDFKSIVEKYADLLGGNDKIVFVIHPLVHEYDRGEYYLAFNDLKAILQAEGVKTLDVLDCFKNKQVQSKSIYWKLDMHFNSKGYNQVANCILDKNWITP